MKEQLTRANAAFKKEQKAEEAQAAWKEYEVKQAAARWSARWLRERSRSRLSERT